MRKRSSRRRGSVPKVAVVSLRPVSKRLASIEDLLLEIRNEQDVTLKYLLRLQAQVDVLRDRVTASHDKIHRLATRIEKNGGG